MDSSDLIKNFDQEFYAATIETIQDGVFVVKDGAFVLVNQAFANMVGHDKSQIIDKPFTQFIAPEYEQLVLERYQQRISGEQPPSEYEFEILHSNGDRIAVQLKVNAFKSKDGSNYSVCSLRNISPLKKLVNKLQASEAEMRQIIVNMPGIFYRTNSSGQITMASPYSIEILGYDEEEVIGKPLSQFYADPNQRAEALTKIMQGEGKPVEVESLLRKRDGSTIWVSTSAYARFDETGQFIGVEGISRNITERKKLESELRDMAVKDQLTGLLNRFGLHEHLEQALNRARRKHSFVSIIYIDLDDFKLVNDRYGHLAGDEYLVEFSRRLNKSFRESDLVSRVGGDEFVVLLDENTMSESIENLLSRLCRIMSEPKVIGEDEILMQYSYGVASFPKHGTDASELLNYADQEMYQSKQGMHR